MYSEKHLNSEYSFDLENKPIDFIEQNFEKSKK